MTAIIIPRRHYTQPQGRVEVAPFVDAGKSFLFNAGSGATDLATGKLLQYVGEPVFNTGPQGRYFDCGEKVNAIYRSVTNDPTVTNRQQYLLFAVFQHRTLGSSTQTNNGFDLSGDYGKTCAIGNGGEYSAYIGATVRPSNQLQSWVSPTRPADGTIFSLALLVRTGAQPYVSCTYIEVPGNTRTERAYLSSTVTNAADGYKYIAVGGNAYQSAPPIPLNKRILCAAVLTQENISSAMADELVENPWQLFRADPIRIYSLPSGAITLGTPSITNITPSGFRVAVGLS